jgi:MoaA/NifB/PqqE/SkfB family radical SAM enzyme
MTAAIGDAIAAGVLPGRVWLYSNYHCNLACAYCLTESAPRSAKRELGAQRMIAVAEQAHDLGFTHLGVTGGEPFLLPYLVDVLAALASRLPTVVLTNATLFSPPRLAQLRPLVGLPLAVQISLDSPDPEQNDELRGPHNFAKVLDAIPRLVGMGLRVRIATTAEPGRLDEERHARLCALHRALGVPDEDHLIRPVIRRGRAVGRGLGRDIPHTEIPAELTITVDGAFWSPFGPTVEGGRLDTDLLLTRATDPLAVPARVLLRLVEGRPAGDDAQISIR